MIYLFPIFQNILHVVSGKEKLVEGYDVVSGSWLYGRVFFTSQPYAITVYDAETIRSYDGMTFFIPALSKESSGILLLPLSVRPPAQRISRRHLNSVYILRHSQIIV